MNMGLGVGENILMNGCGRVQKEMIQKVNWWWRFSGCKMMGGRTE
jgi:hypothetical protein